ncbi:glycosyltransferase family A protein [Maricaulis parjimensis]|uniref:glycosyltransferase family A protein n=1 Tax=Maricaulis parjimensis TaxID=144023 RepID=UPI00193A35F7|nr:glycosyltransferase family A protein [Maricaulis parjimensis]
MRDTSLLIPLYQSSRFFDVICENIDCVLPQGGQVIVSDQQGEDDCVARLRDRYGHLDTFTALDAREDGNWVSNSNRLMRAVRTEFFRIVPHDDSVSLSSFLAMRARLRACPDAVLCYGPVHAISLDGHRLPERDQIHDVEDTSDRAPWSAETAADLFWTGRFGGAFKGLVRTHVVQQNQVYMRETPRLEHSERAWLFALAMIGRFVHAPRGVLTKRYYPESTHRQWRAGAQERAEATRVMREFARDLIRDRDAWAKVDTILVGRQEAADGPASIRPLLRAG